MTKPGPAQGCTTIRRHVAPARSQKHRCDLQANTYAGTAGHCRLYQRARTTHRGTARRAGAAGEPLSAANRATADYECGRPHGARAAANRQANRDRAGGRSVAGAAPDDRRPVALASAGGKAGRAAEPGRFRFSPRLAGADGSRHQAAGVVARLAGEEGCGQSIPAESTSFASDARAFRAALTAENHTLKRALTDPRMVSGIGNAYSDEILHAARLSPVTLTHKLTRRSGNGLRRDARHAELWIERLRAEAAAGFPGKSDGVSQGHGGSRTLRAAVPAVRREGSADPLRGQRNQLLRSLPDGRKAAGGSRPVAAAAGDWPRTLGRTGSVEAAVGWILLLSHNSEPLCCLISLCYRNSLQHKIYFDLH